MQKLVAVLASVSWLALAGCTEEPLVQEAPPKGAFGDEDIGSGFSDVAEPDDAGAAPEDMTAPQTDVSGEPDLGEPERPDQRDDQHRDPGPEPRSNRAHPAPIVSRRGPPQGVRQAITQPIPR